MIEAVSEIRAFDGSTWRVESATVDVGGVCLVQTHSGLAGSVEVLRAVVPLAVLRVALALAIAAGES
jgi:hypothetical protein